MKIYEKSIIVTEDDLDDMNHVNNVRYVQWVQDIAKEHWFTLAPENFIKNYAWVVLSHHIEYKNAALLSDPVKIQTYITKSEGVTSVRMVEMHHAKTGKLIAKAESTWCLLNAKTGKPTRIPQEITDLFH